MRMALEYMFVTITLPIRSHLPVTEEETEGQGSSGTCPQAHGAGGGAGGLRDFCRGVPRDDS